MANKVEIDSVEHYMSKVGIGQKEAQEVINELKKELELLAAQKANEPKPKKYKYIIANTDVPAGTSIEETPMVVVEAEEEVNPHEVVNEIINASLQANNDVKKLKKDPVKSVFDGIERVQSKFFKERKIRVITKEICQVLKTDNKLPDYVNVDEE
jgi:hypothetical protein